MADSVQMPALGESVTEGTVTRWLKQVGERIEIDEPLLEVSTDKVDTEIPSPIAGVLEEILVAEDETVAVGTELARIGGGEAGSDTARQDGTAQQDGQQDQSEPEPAPAASQPEQVPAEAPSTETSEPAPAPSAPTGGGDGEGAEGGTTVQMPALGESVTEGTVTRWLKQVGDDVAVDEPLLEVSTDKVDTEIPSPVGGRLSRILVNEDETVPVGADLAVVGGSGGASAPAQPEAKQPEPQATQPAPEPKPTPAPEPTPAPAPAPTPAPTPTPPAREARPAATGTAGDNSAYMTPLVRRMAAERGVDLSLVTGTGVGGRIRKQDVLEAAEAARKAQQVQPAAQPAQPAAAAPSAPAKAPAEVSPLRGQTVAMTRLRKVIAQRMVESLQVSAQLTTVMEVDVTRIARLREAAKADFGAREGVKLSFMPFFALATVEALKQFPMLNASVEGDQITYHDREHLGVAVDTERGLLVPVIRDAGDLNIAGIARKIAELADRTRNNKITPDELGGGTFTLTNTGSRGALFDTPIINQPQTGILGTGAVIRRPVVVAAEDGGETIAIRSMCYLALSYDHRIVDGADAARFLAALKERLEEGSFEADLGL